MGKRPEDNGKVGGIRVLLECKPLLVLAAALALFHLGNAAMLPLYGLAVVATKQGEPASFVAMTIVIAQAVMIGVSLIAMRMAEKEGYWLVLLILGSFALGSIALWLGFAATLKPACIRHQAASTAPVAARAGGHRCTA
jgi:hypothetical protein